MKNRIVALLSALAFLVTMGLVSATPASANTYYEAVNRSPLTGAVLGTVSFKGAQVNKIGNVFNQGYLWNTGQPQVTNWHPDVVSVYMRPRLYCWHNGHRYFIQIGALRGPFREGWRYNAHTYETNLFSTLNPQYYCKDADIIWTVDYNLKNGTDRLVNNVIRLPVH